mmetsp:Transcript_21170/g.52471  ORF Transcript_21170/g.52471 Transcript_21170/m.52471 type:complete len:215 (+) Transcript_21170:3148-3792(+)
MLIALLGLPLLNCIESKLFDVPSMSGMLCSLSFGFLTLFFFDFVDVGDLFDLDFFDLTELVTDCALDSRVAPGDSPSVDSREIFFFFFFLGWGDFLLEIETISTDSASSFVIVFFFFFFFNFEDVVDTMVLVSTPLLDLSSLKLANIAGELPSPILDTFFFFFFDFDFALENDSTVASSVPLILSSERLLSVDLVIDFDFNGDEVPASVFCSNS